MILDKKMKDEKNDEEGNNVDWNYVSRKELTSTKIAAIEGH